MSNTSRIQLVCFDLGGVLIRICRSWEEGCRAAGLDVRGESSIVDPAGANGRRDLSKLHQSGKISCEEFFREIAVARNNLYSPSEIQRIHDAWLLGEYANVSDVIERIHKVGRRTAALSNTNLSHWVALQDFASVRALQHPLASHELGMVKPDEAIYREAEQRFGVSGEAILFFDDLIENVAAAQSVGWDAVHIDHTGDPAVQFESALRERGVLR